MISKKPAYEPEDKRKKTAEQEHAGDGKKELKVPPFDVDVTRQVAEPAQEIAKQQDYPAGDDKQESKDKYDFADIVHNDLRLLQLHICA